MAVPQNRADWCREKLDFLCAVINNADRECLKAELEKCETEDEAAGLLHSLLWMQDNMHAHNHHPHTHAPHDHRPHAHDPHDLHDNRPHAQDPYDPLDHRPHAPDPYDLHDHRPHIHDPYDAHYHDLHNNRPHPYNPYDHRPHDHDLHDNRPYAHDRGVVTAEPPERRDAMDHNHDDRPPQRVHQPGDAEGRPQYVPLQDHQHHHLENQHSARLDHLLHQDQHHNNRHFEQQQRQQLQQQQQLLQQLQQPQVQQQEQQRAEYPEQVVAASDAPRHDLEESTSQEVDEKFLPPEDLSDFEETESFEDIPEDQGSSEDTQPAPHDYNIQYIPLDDDEADEIEPNDQTISDPYFDADEPPSDDFGEMDEALLDDSVTRVGGETSSEVDALAAAVIGAVAVAVATAHVATAHGAVAPTTADVAAAAASATADIIDAAAAMTCEPSVQELVDTKDDERLARELEEALNEEIRETMAGDERLARELERELEMEERRREERDEQLARRLAGEVVADSEEEAAEQEVERQQDPSDAGDGGPPAEVVMPDDDDDELQGAAAVIMEEDEAFARQLEVEEESRECGEEDVKARRVAVLINMFPDADPTYLEERIAALEGEEEYQRLVEELLQRQRTEPRMSGYQKKLKQQHVHPARNARAGPDQPQPSGSQQEHQAPFECTICFEDQVPAKDMATCSALYKYHEFCIECVRRHVATLIGQGYNSFKCMSGYCEAEFSWRTLRRVMDPVVYQKVQERRQQEEVRAAGLDNLVACPFCSFMVIMPDPENKVLECLNPECLRESCRMCKEPSHIPLRCEEVEKDVQKDARTVLEEKMAEAMIRQCPKCGKRFVTEGGCNKMTCSCGTVMCYLCKKVITDGYHHFEQRQVASSKCPLWSNATEVHRDEVRDAAARGRQELDPDINLVHDPTTDML